MSLAVRALLCMYVCFDHWSIFAPQFRSAAYSVLLCLCHVVCARAYMCMLACVLGLAGDDVYGKKLASLAEVLLGPPGSKVALEFRSAADGSTYAVVLERGIPMY